MEKNERVGEGLGAARAKEGMEGQAGKGEMRLSKEVRKTLISPCPERSAGTPLGEKRN